MFFNWFIFPAESPVHNNTRNSTLYLQPRADARYSHNNRPFSTTIHHRCLCLSCVRECEYILSIVHYCCESCEWRGSVLGRHLGSGEMSSGFIYTGCGTYTCGNWTMRKTMRTIMSMWQQGTQNTKQHDIKKSCHPFLAYKHPLVLYFALQVGRSTSQYNYWAVHFNHIVNIIVIPPPAVLPRRWIDRRAGAQYLQFIIFKHMFTFTARNT